jgi:hypothetical protein
MDAERMQTMESKERDNRGGMGRTGEGRTGNGDDADMTAPQNPAVGAPGANFGETDPGSTLSGTEIDENGTDDNVGATVLDESRRSSGGAA